MNFTGPDGQRNAPTTASPHARASFRLPYAGRRKAKRAAAGARLRARVEVPLSEAQRTRDPLTHKRDTEFGRFVRGIGATLASVGVHIAIVGLGILSGSERGKRDVVEQKITIEVKEPPKPPEMPKEEAKPDKPAEPAPPPKVAKAPKPKTPEPPPAETPKTPPPRVVGLSLESTSEGGGGPAFAVGNTRSGVTDTKAVAPEAVPKEAPPAEPAPGQNKVASRLPSSGVSYTPPHRKHEAHLRYPETLKTQGLEADVKVSLAIDAAGKVTAVRIITPSPYPEFNEAAKATALSEEFEPALRDGIPIPYSLPFTYRFRLQDE